MDELTSLINIEDIDVGSITPSEMLTEFDNIVKKSTPIPLLKQLKEYHINDKLEYKKIPELPYFHKNLPQLIGTGLEDLSLSKQLPPKKVFQDNYDGQNDPFLLSKSIYLGENDINDEFFREQARLLLGYYDERLIDALRCFKDGEKDCTIGSTFLPRFFKEGFHLSDKQLSRYLLQLDITKTRNGGIPNRLEGYCDVPFQFHLRYDGDTIMRVGFEAQLNRVAIRQIQGRWGNPEALKPIKAERALVSYAVQWAERYGIPEISIQAAKNNKYKKVNCTNRGKMLYDVTAKRSGFKERLPNGDYLRRLKVPVPTKIN